MSRFPWLPLFTDAFIADTTHLNATETGAYVMLLMVAWRMPDCRLPDEDQKLMRWARVDARCWQRIKAKIMAFWALDDDGFWSQGRLLKERQFVDERAARSRVNGSLGGRKPKNPNKNLKKPAGFSAGSDFNDMTPDDGCASTPLKYSKSAVADPGSSSARQDDNSLILQQADNPMGSYTEPRTNLPIPIPIKKKDGPDGPSSDLFPNTTGLAVEAPDARAYRLGEEVLGPRNGGLITKLLKAKGGNVDLAMGALYQAKAAHNPREYIGGCLRQRREIDDDGHDPAIWRVAKGGII